MDNVNFVYWIYIIFNVCRTIYKEWNGSHYITVEECKETYNCDCTYDDGEMCLCTLKKWFTEKEYFCVREDISDNQIIKE